MCSSSVFLEREPKLRLHCPALHASDTLVRTYCAHSDTHTHHALRGVPTHTHTHTHFLSIAQSSPAAVESGRKAERHTHTRSLGSDRRATPLRQSVHRPFKKLERDTDKERERERERERAPQRPKHRMERRELHAQFQTHTHMPPKNNSDGPARSRVTCGPDPPGQTFAQGCPQVARARPELHAADDPTKQVFDEARFLCARSLFRSLVFETPESRAPAPSSWPERALPGPKDPRVCGEAAKTALCSLGISLKTLFFCSSRWGRAPVFRW